MKMSKVIQLSAWSGAVLYLAACATATVSSDYDKSVDFSKIRTFAWGEDRKPAGDLRFDDPALRQVVKDEVTRQLTSKGLRLTGPGTADVLLKSYITVELKEDQMADYAMTYPPAYEPGVGITNLNTCAVRDAFMFKYEDGTFVLDMVDARTRTILWRGTLEGMVDPAATPEKRISRVPAAVAKVLAKYPPR
ncbi:MAG TPA: DUF4136 domain-containing protein [Candidatus Omnitrophota bacterium]|jgi:hypothetical protein|nr:DUF4136 domain-containing protein [Candidatus Omnitrophota bacterium]